jgi:hypothetical protein
MASPVEADQAPKGLHNDCFVLDEKTGWAVRCR